VEVSESFRETICRTVEHFSGKKIERDLIQRYKNEGGWNNDWELSTQIIRDLGTEVAFDDVAGVFNDLFLGPAHDGVGGLVQREVWMPRDGLLQRLGARYGLAIFTGRLRVELSVTLTRFASNIDFEPTICSDEIENNKPAPDGLLKIAAMNPGSKLWYIGDTVDDARSAKAAGVPFIGIAAAGNLRRDELVKLFETDGAVAVLENVNELEAALPQ
jgi:HAD superfamily hydrolase (TIGR01548 family)